MINEVCSPEGNRKKKIVFLPWFIDRAMYKTNTTNDVLVGNKLAQLLDFHIAVDGLVFFKKLYKTFNTKS